MTAKHPWKLVAPWYRWARQAETEGRPPAQTRPVFQKFDHPDFIKSFVRDPQRSLKFSNVDDRVFNAVVTEVPKLVSAPFAGRLTRLFAPRTASGALPETAREAKLAPTGLRKLYLATHKRFYLVVCELHCHVAGFPSTRPDQVCQAGFVVRRRSLEIPAARQVEARQGAEVLLREIDTLQADLAQWDDAAPAHDLEARRRQLRQAAARADGTLDPKRKALLDQFETAASKLTAWRATFEVRPTLEGWFPGDFESLGSWAAVPETPPELTEASFPLYPLFPDPRIPDHSAAGHNLYYGVVPTSSLDTDASGVPRFDSDTTYEIRCFVRRHKLGCPRRRETPDCHGELVWSEPTESYRLATPTDLTGTSQQPVTLRMPDFAELAAQAAALPVRRLAPVRVIHPQSMKFNVQDGKASGGGIGGFQICFFSLPLITIVAMFVLKLFLPVVVFLFGLFFLLRLKFCIPPSLSVNAGVFAKMAALMPKLEANASLNVDAQFDASLGLNFSATDLNTDLRDAIAVEHGIVDPSEKAELGNFSNAALLPLGVTLDEAATLTGSDGRPKPEAGPDLAATLEFEPRVPLPAARVGSK